MKDGFRVHCPVCKKPRLINKRKGERVILPHPNVNGIGKCSGGGKPHPAWIAFKKEKHEQVTT